VTSLVIHEDHIRRIDPKGSVLVNIDAGETNNIPLLE
jgi:hypothetical protein